MTESEWNIWTDPQQMLMLLKGNTSDRKQRLFAVGCCRSIWHLLDDGNRQTIRFAESYADGTVTDSELITAATHTTAGVKKAMASSKAWLAYYSAVDTNPATKAPEDVDEGTWAVFHAVDAAASPERPYPAEGAGNAGDAFAFSKYADCHHPNWDREREREWLRQCRLLRCIFGPLPFRPVTIDPAWFTSTVVSLAQAMYDERAFDRMPVLADALEESGCTSQEMLGHCRGGGEHVRGCWLVDLVLGKS